MADFRNSKMEIRNSEEARVVASFAREEHNPTQSFPRKRESSPQMPGNELSAEWIPAFAGTTVFAE
jgi:hypothetical protein